MKLYQIPIHLDGARLWNASIATGKPLIQWTHHVDSVSVCFSKGLGAPVGSVLTGSHSFIKRARHLRKLMGGGWRQAGVLAAACLYSLHHILPLLKKDHENALLLANGLESMGFQLFYPTETNMVWLDTRSSPILEKELPLFLRAHGIQVFDGNSKNLRFVLHHQIHEEGVLRVLELVKKFKLKFPHVTNSL